MSKPLTDAIRDQLLQSKGKSRVTRCRPIILSLWEEIESALKAGWPLRSIWQTLHDGGNYPSTYESFRINVRDIQRTGLNAEKSKEKQKSATPEKAKTQDSPQQERKDWDKGDTWRPEQINEKDLI